MRDTGTAEACRISSSALFPSSGRENPTDDCPLGDLCLCVSSQVLFAAYHQGCFFFPFCDAMIRFLLCFPPSAIHVADLHEFHPCQCHFTEKHFSQQITCLGWKLLTIRVTARNQIPDNDWGCGLTPESGRTPVDFTGAGLHISVHLKLKQGADWLAHFKTIAQLPVFLQPGPRTQLASLRLGWTQLPSAEPSGCRGRVHGFAEPQFKVGAGCGCGQTPAFVSSTLHWPYESCPALNLRTGTVCKVNCSATQHVTLAIYILPVITGVIRASAAW